MNLITPPQNIDAERSILGAILLDTEALPKVADTLRPENFYSPQHAIIYECILQLFQAAKPVDLVTLTSQLKKANKLQQVGGSAYLSELIAMVPTAAHMQEYASIVREESVRRSLISLASRTQELAMQQEKRLEEIMDEVESRLFNLSKDNTQRDFQTAAELLEKHFEITEEYSKNPNALRGLPTGLRDVDAILGGLHKSDLIILAARPSVGKTSFALDIGRHIAVEAEKSVAIFSLEMPALQVMQRVLSQQINVSLWDIRMGQYTDAAYARVADGADKLARARLFVDDTPGLSAMQLRSKSRKLKLEQGLDLIIVDYLQLMQGNTRHESRVQEIAEISRSLKLLARELEVPIVALAQLNRAVENRTDRIPQLSDLRDSGSIEQDADVVMFLSREKLFNPESNKDTADVFIAKHRNGAIGKVELRFVEENTKFVDVS
jgi:replicative DNA helicase